jgi:hypothetical protein
MFIAKMPVYEITVDEAIDVMTVKKFVNKLLVDKMSTDEMIVD